MKKVFIVLTLAMIFMSCNNNPDKLATDLINNPNTANGINENTARPIIEFVKNEHDFGQVLQGEIVSYSFRFTNTGNADLIITNVSTSCGCTASEYPVDAIKPGETKKIKAIFDSENRSGFQNKRITVLTNATPAKSILKIKANVIDPTN